MSGTYEISEFVPLEKSISILQPIDSKFVIELKKLRHFKVIVANGELLDELAHRVYGNELLWWVVGLYNDILDPLSLPKRAVYFPVLSDVEKLMLNYREST